MAYRMRLATYNVGDFNGKNIAAGTPEAVEIYRELITAVGADLWAFQEDQPYFYDDKEEGPYEALYSMYKNYERRGTGRYNYKAFLSDMEIRDVEQVYYDFEAKYIGHKWFLRGTVTMGEHDICLINVHLDWVDKFVREKQIKQILEYVKAYEYSVIIGDFNPDDYIDSVKQSNENLMAEELKHFTAAGYKAANAGAFGTLKTFVNGGGAPIDNILVSSNIRIEAVGIARRPWMNDHAPLWADIVIDS